ncbi:MAG: nucleotidyl transferase AbiEii/AbiGii toxin family protein, partial [Proteobacteria bacterium]|nr:nucleotidyl transferase AbiEii/AbiGii toxin family protein [Pseudomonadota bacterium]
IIQRGKSRDYFDAWMLLTKNKFDKDRIKDLFMEKCKFKNIRPDYELFFDDTKLNEARDFWEKGLARLNGSNSVHLFPAGRLH